MKILAITQRVEIFPDYHERRDALDQKWTLFLKKAGFTPLPLPNHLDAAISLAKGLDISGIVLTGGNDLGVLGGDAPERDELERALLALAVDSRIPVLGVCRGMQVIQEYFGGQLVRVEGHVAAEQEITIDGELRIVNSYHNWGSLESPDTLIPFAIADDGVIKGIRHQSLPMLGMMWHPERAEPLCEHDISLFKNHFAAESRAPSSVNDVGTTYWVTGLSGSGKTTVGRQLVEELRKRGRPVVFIDGDEIREVLGNDLGHSLEDRRASAMRNARMCQMLSRQGVDVVCCTISMFKGVRYWNRKNIPGYREIYLEVPMSVLKNRDPKGLYGRAEAGELKNVYGIDLDWDEPECPDYKIRNDGSWSPKQVVENMLSQLPNR